MKKKKTGACITDGIPIEQFAYVFTKDEKKLILDEFKTWTPNVEALSGGLFTQAEAENFEPEFTNWKNGILEFFLNTLEGHVSFFRTLIKDAPPLHEHIAEVQSTIKNLKSVQRQIQRLSDNRLFVPLTYSVRDVNPGYLLDAMFGKKQTATYAHKTMGPLQALIDDLEFHLEKLENLKQATGKPSADMNSGLVLTIGELLRDYLKIKPTAYVPESSIDRLGRPITGGLFYRLTKTVLEILQLPAKDPRRLIKKAVKTLSKKPA